MTLELILLLESRRQPWTWHCLEVKHIAMKIIDDFIIEANCMFFKRDMGNLDMQGQVLLKKDHGWRRNYKTVTEKYYNNI